MYRAYQNCSSFNECHLILTIISARKLIDIIQDEWRAYDEIRCISLRVVFLVFQVTSDFCCFSGMKMECNPMSGGLLIWYHISDVISMQYQIRWNIAITHYRWWCNMTISHTLYGCHEILRSQRPSGILTAVILGDILRLYLILMGSGFCVTALVP